MTTIIDYPRITRNPTINLGESTVNDSKIPVWIIVGYYQMGMSEDEILSGFPQLQPADIFSALAFYFENKSEMDSLIEQYGNEYDQLKTRFNAWNKSRSESLSRNLQLSYTKEIMKTFVILSIFHEKGKFFYLTLSGLHTLQGK